LVITYSQFMMHGQKNIKSNEPVCIEWDPLYIVRLVIAPVFVKLETSLKPIEKLMNVYVDHIRRSKKPLKIMNSVKKPLILQ